MVPQRPIDKIYYSSHFEKVYKKLSSVEKELIKQREKIIRQDIFDLRLKTRPLKGRLKRRWAFSVTYSDRIMFRFLSDKEVLFLDIGPHDIYR